MAWTQDKCTPMVADCVVVHFRDICLDRNSLQRSVTGSVTLNNVPAGHSLDDGNNAFFLGLPYVQKLTAASYVLIDADGEEVTELGEDETVDDYCVYLTVKTCELFANVDSDHDPDDPLSVNRALNVEGTYYTISFKIGTSSFSYDFVIDAAATYTDFCGCIPIREVAVEGSFPPPDITPGDPFTERICEVLGSYEPGGELPFDGTVRVVGLDNAGECKVYTISESCNLETMQHIADVLV